MPTRAPLHQPHLARQAAPVFVPPNAQRGTAAQRGYGSRWQSARHAYLGRHPLCVECQRENRLTAATVVDHIRPHRLAEALKDGSQSAIRSAQSLFWDQDNWQALCKTHHDAKTAREDGGFGNRRQGDQARQR